MRLVALLSFGAMTALCCRHEAARPEPVERTPVTVVRKAVTKLDSRVAPYATEAIVALPPPHTSGGLTVAAALAKRRSHRNFAATMLEVEQFSQLAWSAQGITAPTDGLRTAPSAGALYPLEVYFVTPEGVHHYLPKPHAFERKHTGDLREALANAALGQSPVQLAPCTVVITGVSARTALKYGARATRYVALETGHVAQNLLLEATSLGLVSVPIGAFDDDKLTKLLALPPGEEPLYLIAIGHPL